MVLSLVDRKLKSLGGAAGSPVYPVGAGWALVALSFELGASLRCSVRRTARSLRV